MNMKAWSVTDDEEYMYATIVFAETRGKAKVIAQGTDACADVDFTHIRAIRVPQLDSYYRGLSEMDWYNDNDMIAMVRYANMMCSYEVDIEKEDCLSCPAHEWCDRYESMCDDGGRNERVHSANLR